MATLNFTSPTYVTCKGYSIQKIDKDDEKEICRLDS